MWIVLALALPALLFTQVNSFAATAELKATYHSSDHSVVAEGAGFPGGVEVTLAATFGATVLESKHTSSDTGTFVATVAVPKEFSGLATLTAKSKRTIGAAIPSVAPDPTVTPNTGDPAPNTDGSVANSGTTASTSVRIFAANSLWYQALPANLALNPNTAGLAKTINEDAKAHGTNLNYHAYAPPIYEVAADAPTVRVNHRNCGAGSPPDPKWLASTWGVAMEAVPVPVDALPAEGSDGEIVIWQSSTDTVWEFWQFQRSGATASACWGGRIPNVSQSSGIFEQPFGVAATGMSFLAGTIRASELTSGEINHVMQIGINRPKAGVHSWPANRNDGVWDSPDAIPEGLRLRLDPSLDVDALNIHPVAKIIAKSGQKYGFIVRDNTGGPIVIYSEDIGVLTRSGQPDPYTTTFGPTPNGGYLKDFPWEHVQFLPMDYGKP